LVIYLSLTSIDKDQFKYKVSNVERKVARIKKSETAFRGNSFQSKALLKKTKQGVGFKSEKEIP
jgi:hypothetical protein